jgi:hypothetical protein
MHMTSWKRVVALAAALALLSSCKKSASDAAGTSTNAPPAPAPSGDAVAAPETPVVAPLPPDSTKLPAAATATAATPDEAAAELAKAVLAGGNAALPALLAALQRSGIDVRDMDLDNRVVREPDQPRQGMALQAGEVLLAGQLVERGYSVVLLDVATVIATAYKLEPVEESAHDLAQGIVEALRQHAESNVPTMRFWARFIIELGKQGSGEYDLLDPEHAVGMNGKVPLDGAQTTLILLRLAGDIGVLQAKLKEKGKPSGPAPDATAGRSVPRLPGGWYATSETRPGRRLPVDVMQPGTFSLLLALLPESGAKQGGSVGTGGSQGTAGSVNEGAGGGGASQVGGTAGAVKGGAGGGGASQVGGTAGAVNEGAGGGGASQVGGAAGSVNEGAGGGGASQVGGTAGAVNEGAGGGGASVGPGSSGSGGGGTVLGTGSSGGTSGSLGGGAGVGGSQANMGPGSAAGGGSSDCNTDNATGIAQDAAATATTTGFGKVLEELYKDYAEHVGDAAGMAFGMINAGLQLLKFIFNAAMLDVKIEFDGGAATLERTKSSSHDGLQKGVKATLQMKANALRYLNCYRFLLNTMGIDFNTNNDGPIEGAQVTWKLYAGGASGSGDLGIVQFVGNPITRTDAQGVARVTLEGVHQKRDLAADSAPVNKPATVAIEVVIKDSSLVQDLVDAIGAALGGPMGVAVSLLERMVPLSSSQAFTVIDWTSDYIVDWEHSTGLKIYGGTCTTPVGDWQMEVSGKLSSGGVEAEIGGEITATIDESYQGPFEGQMRLSLVDVPISIPPVVVDFSGDAKFVPGDHPKLILHSTQASGGINGPVGVPGDMRGHVEWNYNSSLPQWITLPVQVGTFSACVPADS